LLTICKQRNAERRTRGLVCVDVYFWNAATAGYLARTGLSADTGEVAGQALSEAFPSAPFTSDKHFCEIGHITQTTAAPGLARTILHQN